jgi:polyhydroxyalkanoate synthesis regulator phasin
MDAIDFGKLLQKGFYVTLGATASLLEVLQDPRKQEEKFGSLRRDFDSLTQELAEKGVVTESEARSLVDGFIARQIKTHETSPVSDVVDSVVKTVNTTATNIDDAVSNPKVSSNVQSDLKDLTQQIADLRAELESLRVNSK